MAKEAAGFTGNIPQNYDEGLGPLLFVPYAVEIAARATKLRPRRVLELAAGTGIVSRVLRDRLPATTDLTITDLNKAMLNVAEAKFREGENVTIEVADGQALPFDNGAFDLIVSQFGVMFFPDKTSSFREAGRVLTRRGHYIFNVWGPIAHNPFAAITSQVTAQFLGGKPPAFFNTPYGYHDVKVIKAALKDAGLKDIRHDVKKVRSLVRDWALLARGIFRGSPLSAEIKAPADEVEAALVEAYRKQLGREPYQMPLEAIFFSARAP